MSDVEWLREKLKEFSLEELLEARIELEACIDFQEAKEFDKNIGEDASEEGDYVGK